jgi:hypothetical protein
MAMDRISLWSALLVSYPEELLIVLIALAAAGYRDVLNFREKKNLIKLLLSVSLMVVSAVVGRVLVPSITLNSIIQAGMFYFIIIVVYRYRLLPCAIGLILSLSTLIGTEAIFGSMLTKIFHLQLSQLYPHLIAAILFSFPDRVVQILTLVLICKKKDISFKIEKLSLNELIPIILYCLMIISSMFSIENGISIMVTNSNSGSLNTTLLSLTLNIGLAVIFCSWLIYNIFKVRERVALKDEMHDFDLQSILQMLLKGQVDHVIELIKQQLRDRENKK